MDIRGAIQTSIGSLSKVSDYVRNSSSNIPAAPAGNPTADSNTALTNNLQSYTEKLPGVTSNIAGGGSGSSALYGGAKWNTSLDAGVGDLDKRIKDLQGYEGTQSAQTDQLNQLKQQRQAANTQRWASVNWQALTGPGAQHVHQLLNTGALSYQDLGNLDVSHLDDDQGLATAVDQLMADKAAKAAGPAAVAPTATTAETETQKSLTDSTSPVNTTKTNATNAVDSFLPDVMKYAADAKSATNADNALGQFESTALQNQNAISSVTARGAHQVGGAIAGAEANHYGTNQEANTAVQRDVVHKNVMSDVNDYISKAISGDIDMQKDLTGLDTKQKLDIQKQGTSALIEELRKATATGGANAQAQMGQLDDAVKAWNTAIANGEEGTKEHQRIIALAAGIALGVGGAALAIGSGGSAAVPGMLIAATGVKKTTEAL